MTLRRLFFWMHLTAGSVAAAVILLMSATGVLLMYEKQITAWVDRDIRTTPPLNATHLGPEELLAKAQALTGKLPQSLLLRPDPAEPATLSYGRDSILYLDPYSGAKLGEGSTRVRSFFQSVTAWHRWLGFDTQAPGRNAARSIADACNFAFVFLALSGAYLWLPRKWSWKGVRAIAWFRGGLSGRARDFNWHNVAGAWCCLPLALIAASGVVMSYPWASNLVYKFAGSNPPEQGRGDGGRGRDSSPANLTFTGMNDAWRRAEQQRPGWQSISLRVPASNRAPLVFTIDRSNGGQPQKRGTLTLDRATGQIRSWETFESQERGRRWRSWFRFTHTGEYYGIAGQSIAGIASAGGVLLVWTGISLALRRFRRWKRGGAAAEQTARHVAEVSAASR